MKQNTTVQPEIVINNPAEPLRVLTPLEFAYARSRLRREGARRHILLGIGLMIVLTGLVAAVVLAGETEKLDPAAVLVAPPFLLVMTGVGAWMIFIGIKRKLALLDGAYVIEGTLEKHVTRLANPGSGYVSTNCQYRIGDANIVWPPGADSLYQSFVNQRIQVTAALITRSHTIVLFGGNSKYDEQPRDAVVLEFGDTIRIHHALQRYGTNLFRIYSAQWTFITLFFVAYLAAGIYYVVEKTDLSANASFFVIGGLVFGGAIAGGLLYFAYYSVSKALGFEVISMEEKLKG